MINKKKRKIWREREIRGGKVDRGGR